MSRKLENKVAVITGATSGMALATAKLFVEEGAYVYITGRRQEQLDAAVKHIGKNVTGVRADSGSLDDLDRLYEIVKKEKGHIDVLYASSGVGHFGIGIDAITPEEYDRVFDINVKGTIFTVQKALPLLSEGASIIMTGSIASVKGFPGMGIYSASKAAIRSLARTWTLDLQARKIRVNVLSPGSIDTATFDGVPQEIRDSFTEKIPMGRFGTSEEIASTALFLASSDSTFITGIELFVDGGTAQI
ncbi:SDR family NAD(P)-dependent oxidoreductase [Pedobacter panaciterrae]|jgi:NAD(P)-dependent dehydrogenase (short-subunit alcohol dehydrogenase family)|uniref:SDR family NAD(P)-dependent oxidoreductase n=1 Tax=Pedobacter panaciterrae TaxID=363849 RepID=UPI002594C99C|nr:SDR family oxidoreductase [uncultured Pedobacter sp.]